MYYSMGQYLVNSGIQQSLGPYLTLREKVRLSMVSAATYAAMNANETWWRVLDLQETTISDKQLDSLLQRTCQVVEDLSLLRCPNVHGQGLASLVHFNHLRVLDLRVQDHDRTNGALDDGSLAYGTILGVLQHSSLRELHIRQQRPQKGGRTRVIEECYDEPIRSILLCLYMQRLSLHSSDCKMCGVDLTEKGVGFDCSKCQHSFCAKEYQVYCRRCQRAWCHECMPYHERCNDCRNTYCHECCQELLVKFQKDSFPSCRNCHVKLCVSEGCSSSHVCGYKHSDTKRIKTVLKHCPAASGDHGHEQS